MQITSQYGFNSIEQTILKSKFNHFIEFIEDIICEDWDLEINIKMNKGKPNSFCSCRRIKNSKYLIRIFATSCIMLSMQSYELGKRIKS